MNLPVPDGSSTAPQSADPKNKGERSDTWLKVIAGVLAVVAAAGAVLAAYFNTQAGASNKETAQANAEAASAKNSASSLQNVVTGLQNSGASQVDDLNSSIASLQSDNSVLSTQLTAALAGNTPAMPPTITTASSTATIPPNDVGTVYHTEQLLTIIANMTNPDLDAPPSDPQWGEVAGRGADLAPAPSTTTFKVEVPNGASRVILKGTAPSYNTCLQAQPYTNDLIDTSALATGDLVCLRTSAGRVAALAVRDVQPNSLTLIPTVYKKVGDA